MFDIVARSSNDVAGEGVDEGGKKGRRTGG